jgi:hypothetical protein
MHSSLAVTTHGVPLGLLSQKIWARDSEVVGREVSRRGIAAEEKESFKWLERLRESAKACGPKTKLITIADREADILAVFQEAAALKTGFVIRAFRNRPANREDNEQRVKLLKHIRSKPVAGEVQIEFIHPTSEKKKWVHFEVKVSQLRFHNGVQSVLVNVILVKERHATKPLQWLLLTNLALENFADVVEKIQWYRFRWRIETIHKILKSGYQIEDCRLQNAVRLKRYLTLMSIIAWRLYWMQLYSREEPNICSSLFFTDDEWKVLYMRAHKTNRIPSSPPTLYDALRWAAKIGGFLARINDGEPGTQTLWRGLLALKESTQMWLLIKGRDATCG